MDSICKKTKLYPNGNLAICAKKAAAAKDANSAFGIDFTTPIGYLQDSWELYGDGRRIVTDAERMLIVASMTGRFGLDEHVGTVKAIAHFLKECCSSILDTDRSICETDAERAVYDLACEYQEILSQKSLIEACMVADLLGPMIKGRHQVDFGAPCSLDGYARRFYHDVLGLQIPEIDQSRLAGPDVLDVLMPAGRTMIDKMAFDAVQSTLLRAAQNPSDKPTSIAVCAKDPLRLHAIFARTSLAKMAALAVRGNVAFGSSAFGKAFLAASRLIKSGEADGTDNAAIGNAWMLWASDFASSPYARLSALEVSELPSMEGKVVPSSLKDAGLNGIWMSDRTLDAKDAIADLKSVSGTFSLFESLTHASDLQDESDLPNANDAAEKLLRIARSCFDGIDLKIEEQAIRALQWMIDLSSKMGLEPSDPSVIADVLTVKLSEIEITDALSAEHGGLTSPIVEIMPLSDSSSLGTSAFDEVIICDVSDEAFNSKHIAASLDGFAERLGIHVNDSCADRTRSAFFQAVSGASKKLVCIQPMHGFDAKESFPSFCFDELIQARFDGSLKASDLFDDDIANACVKGTKRCQEFLASHVKRAGEEDLQAGIGKRMQQPLAIESLRPVQRGFLKEMKLPERMRLVDGKIVISASSIELYLDCPYRWFIERILRPQEYGEGFGPLEQGSFAHRVLERFYSSFMESKLSSAVGASCKTDLESGRVLPMSDSDYLELFDRSFIAELEQQPSLPISSGRLIPLNRLEEAQVATLKRSMEDAVMLERILLGEFEPYALEERIDPNKPGAEYAGFAINGVVDRVDVKRDGSSFYVLDYKGSVMWHDCGDQCFEWVDGDDGIVRLDPSILPQYVQTLVYAKVMCNLMERIDCVGAIYSSYKARSIKNLVVGAYSASESVLDGISDSGSRVNGSFEEFLELVEQALAVRLDGIKRSQIKADDSSGNPCKYCYLANRGCC